MDFQKKKQILKQHAEKVFVSHKSYFLIFYFCDEKFKGGVTYNKPKRQNIIIKHFQSFGKIENFKKCF